MRSPGSRVFPSAVVSGSMLYIFGGHDGATYRNDLVRASGDACAARAEVPRLNRTITRTLSHTPTLIITLTLTPIHPRPVPLSSP